MPVLFGFSILTILILAYRSSCISLPSGECMPLRFKTGVVFFTMAWIWALQIATVSLHLWMRLYDKVTNPHPAGHIMIGVVTVIFVALVGSKFIMARFLVPFPSGIPMLRAFWKVWSIFVIFLVFLVFPLEAKAMVAHPLFRQGFPIYSLGITFVLAAPFVELMRRYRFASCDANVVPYFTGNGGMANTETTFGPAMAVLFLTSSTLFSSVRKPFRFQADK